MAIGWGLCAAVLFVIASIGLPPPYWCRGGADGASGPFVTECVGPGAAARHPKACGGLDPAALADDDAVAVAAPCNAAAPAAAGAYAGLLCAAAFGYVVADVAADGLTVTYAQREPTDARGKVQTTAYLVRAVGFMLAKVMCTVTSAPPPLVSLSSVN